MAVRKQISEYVAWLCHITHLHAAFTTPTSVHVYTIYNFIQILTTTSFLIIKIHAAHAISLCSRRELPRAKSP